jgi:hypothetical protein
VIVLEIINVFWLFVLLLLVAIVFPESARFLYAGGRFDEARDSLKSVAKTNGELVKYERTPFTFDTEKESGSNTGPIDGGNLYNLSNSRFALNVTLYALLLSCFSFSYWLAAFQSEYIGTDMYVIFYIQGAVCFLAGTLNQVLYPILGLKWLVIIVQTFSTLACFFIILIQVGTIAYEDPDEQKTFIDVGIPIFVLVLCLCI